MAEKHSLIAELIAGRDAQLASLIAEKERLIVERAEELASRDAVIAEANALLSEKQTALDQKEAALAEQSKRGEFMRTELERAERTIAYASEKYANARKKNVFRRLRHSLSRSFHCADQQPIGRTL